MTTAPTPEMRECVAMTQTQLSKLIEYLDGYARREMLEQADMQEAEAILQEYTSKLHTLRGFIKCERTLAYGTRQQQRLAKREADKFRKL